MASKLKNSSWWFIGANIDPWGYSNLLEVKRHLGTNNDSKALRYILGRAQELIGKKRKVKPRDGQEPDTL